MNSHYLKILTVFLLLCYTSSAQKKFKRFLLSGTTVFISGLIDGTVESINYHYEEGFKPRCPNANDKFWNPALSWKNKYKNNDPAQGPRFRGSTTYLAFTTDAYHLLRSANRLTDGFTLAWLINTDCIQSNTKAGFIPGSDKFWKKKWFLVTRDFLALAAIRSIGFHLTYSVVFRKQNI